MLSRVSIGWNRSQRERKGAPWDDVGVLLAPVTQLGPILGSFLAVPLSVIKTMAVQHARPMSRPGLHLSRSCCFLPDVTLAVAAPFSLANECQGEEGLALVVSRGRCHVAERMLSSSPGLWRYTVKKVCHCDQAGFIDRTSARQARFSMESWIIKVWWAFWPPKEGGPTIAGHQLDRPVFLGLAVQIPNAFVSLGNAADGKADLVFPKLLVLRRVVASNERVRRRPKAWCYCFLKQHLFFFTRFSPASLRGAAAISCFADASCAVVIALDAWRSSDKAVAASISQSSRE